MKKFKIMLLASITYLVVVFGATFLVTSCGPDTPEEAKERAIRKASKDSSNNEIINRDAAIKYTENLNFKPRLIFRLDKFQTFIVTADSQGIWIKSGENQYPYVSEYEICPIYKPMAAKPKQDTIRNINLK